MREGESDGICTVTCVVVISLRGGLYEVLTTFPSSILMFVIFSVGGEGGLGGRLHREEGERGD